MLNNLEEKIDNIQEQRKDFIRRGKLQKPNGNVKNKNQARDEKFLDVHITGVETAKERISKLEDRAK